MSEFINPSRQDGMLSDLISPMQLAGKYDGISSQTAAGIAGMDREGYFGNTRPAPAMMDSGSDDIRSRILNQKAIDENRMIHDRIEMYRKTRPQMTPQQHRQLAREALGFT